MKTSQLMMYREIIAVCSQIHTKHINTAGMAKKAAWRYYYKVTLGPSVSYLDDTLVFGAKLAITQRTAVWAERRIAEY